ncbi:hypothetical protein [Catellatospora sp. NPDC049609]|uniref:hypothetical protein n=1 Tax=Catellatospora sp. NPDC049609 TaxID=3155505 RepID=UPI003421E5B5
MSSPTFKVAVVGPSRVGKTTMLNAILADTNKLLGGTSVEVALDEQTGARVRRQEGELRRAIEQREFNAAALRGTDGIVDYRVTLQSASDPAIQVPFHILDYPGRWLNPLQRPQGIARWNECEAHIKNSMMLLVPIDSAVLMESSSAQRAARYELLGVLDVETMVRAWARARNLEEHRLEPAVLVLAPLKCEKYFNDNGGNRNDGAKLRERVREVYQTMFEVLREEAQHRKIKIMYVPIDTYGCVELIDAQWIKAEDQDGVPMTDFSAHYRFRGHPPKRSVKAAGVVVQELCRCLMEGQATLEKAQQRLARARVNDLVARDNEAKGFWGTIGYHLGGERSENRLERVRTGQDIQTRERRVAALQADLQRMAELPNDPRAEEWY